MSSSQNNQDVLSVRISSLEAPTPPFALNARGARICGEDGTSELSCDSNLFLDGLRPCAILPSQMDLVACRIWVGWVPRVPLRWIGRRIFICCAPVQVKSCQYTRLLRLSTLTIAFTRSTLTSSATYPPLPQNNNQLSQRQDEVCPLCSERDRFYGRRSTPGVIRRQLCHTVRS